MTTLEMLKPTSVPMAVGGNERTSLESIVGKLPPELEKYGHYLQAIVRYRTLLSMTGKYPVDEAKHVLDALRGDTSQEVIRKVLNSQLNKICEAFPVHNPTKTDPKLIQRALVVDGEVKLGETVEYAPPV